jgi:DNA-binding NtrC family response regulator
MQTTTRNNESLTVLSISPLSDDHAALQSIFNRSTWTLLKADRMDAVRDVLGQREISVVVCEQELMPGNWTDVLAAIRDAPQHPSLIVTSRLADDYLWAEALNLGAWDVLAKPFDRNEVVRSVKSAWQHWYNEIRMPVLKLRVAS